MLSMKINQYISECLISVINSYNSFTTIFDCANSHYSKGTVCYKCTPSNCHSHQWRINNDLLTEFATKVVNAEKDWSTAETFETLFEKLEGVYPRGNGIGRLVIYDTASRITYIKYHHLRPKNEVYIHAGVYDGAVWLYKNGYITKKPKQNSTIDIEDFNALEFQQLFEVLNEEQYKGLTKSMILESFMCCMPNADTWSFCKKCRLQNKKKGCNTLSD